MSCVFDGTVTPVMYLISFDALSQATLALSLKQQFSKCGLNLLPVPHPSRAA